MVPDRTVHYLFRKNDSRFHSIESVFEIIIPEVGQHFKTLQQELVNGKATPPGVRENLRQLGIQSPQTLYHITGHVNYMALRTGRRTVLTIHDIRSAFTGTHFSRFAKLIFWFWIPALIVKRITVISEFSRKELRKLVPFTARKTVVIHNPVHPDFTCEAKERIGAIARVLLMGTKPNKNLERTLDALTGLPVKLTIVGELSLAQQSLLKETGLEYDHLLDIPHEQLVKCYRETDILCFASLYEGFGMPIIEAQATGRPVITSNLGAMKEVAGAGACLVDPDDVVSIRNGIVKVMQDSGYREQIVAQGLENVKRFSAGAIAEKYMEVYREMMGIESLKPTVI